MYIQKVDMETYPRKAHFDYFRAMGYPYVGLTSNVDITQAVGKAKVKGQSSFLYLLYAVGNAANSVKEFRQRIDGDGIVEYEFCKTSHTVMKADGTYAYCEADPTLSFEEFLEETARNQEQVLISGGLEEESDANSLLFISCLPWVSYTSLIQPVPFPADSNPRITWGKYFTEKDRIMLPVSVLAHHSLIDGKQIADFYESLSRGLEKEFFI
ncbi:chloramphenicol O-acetyltransferase type A [Kineothrix alysoides]|uniref:Chloramphenicol O-acetyltransferase type A n=1 Tax=Kineothrix alysoides TaxID=1469948 RepID=A0A4R1QPK2_9FIRM|nr:CatA-like O-acetyltransferase [Kineothrix alysoides]TCL54831.1 chloramphenicol O-acetyltransferase type A [Kineothrix alysoides]